MMSQEKTDKARGWLILVAMNPASLTGDCVFATSVQQTDRARRRVGFPIFQRHG